MTDKRRKLYTSKKRFAFHNNGVISPTVMLHVDQSKTQQKKIKKELKSFGYRVLSAASYDDMLKIIDDRHAPRCALVRHADKRIAAFLEDEESVNKVFKFQPGKPLQDAREYLKHLAYLKAGSPIRANYFFYEPAVLFESDKSRHEDLLNHYSKYVDLEIASSLNHLKYLVPKSTFVMLNRTKKNKGEIKEFRRWLEDDTISENKERAPLTVLVIDNPKGRRKSIDASYFVRVQYFMQPNRHEFLYC